MKAALDIRFSTARALVLRLELLTNTALPDGLIKIMVLDAVV